jgi:enoyl-CoA hydratase/carnithine racemase
MAVLCLADGKANTMSLDFCETLTARFAAVSSARAVVLTGTGAIFSAGVDLVRLLEGGAPYIRKFLPALSTMLARSSPIRRRLLPPSTVTLLRADACSRAPPTGG